MGVSADQMATQYLSLYLKRNRDEYYTRLQRIRARHSVAEAAHEHGLAGTGLASDEHELAAPLARDSVERRRQRRELAGALEQLTGDRGGGQALHDRHAEDGDGPGVILDDDEGSTQQLRRGGRAADGQQTSPRRSAQLCGRVPLRALRTA